MNAWLEPPTVLGLLTFLTTIVTIYFLYKQLQGLQEGLARERAKISPRLRVGEVTVAGFEIGRSPAFIVSLVNDGATEAQDVAIYVQAEHGEGHRVAWRGEQVVSIPANSEKKYPIRWSAVLSEDIIAAYNSEPWITVSGYFRHEGHETPFCYKYYPWIGERPAYMPYFTPCDFDVYNDVTITPRPARLTPGS